MCPLTLRAHERLRHPAEFSRVKTLGRRFRTRHFLVNWHENGLAVHRLGMVVQKRFWRAVQRNRIKRCLRDFFRHRKVHIPFPAIDIVVVALPGAEKLHPQDIASEINAVLARKEGSRS